MVINGKVERCARSEGLQTEASCEVARAAIFAAWARGVKDREHTATFAAM